MPESTPSPLPSIDQAMSIIVTLSMTVASLVTKVDSLVDTVKQLTEVITASQSSSLHKATSSIPSPLSPPLDPHALARSAYEAAACALRDAKMIEDKGSRAVIVGLLEGSSPEATIKSDQDTLKEMCEWSDDPVVKKCFEDGEVSFHRHPKTAAPNRRPLKIQFSSKEIRDRFLSGIRRKGGRPSPFKNAPRAYVRRDLTPTELKIERERKEEVRLKNIRAGQMAYGLRDTDIISYRNPRPLPSNYGTPSRPLPSHHSAADVSFSGASHETALLNSSTASQSAAISTDNSGGSPPKCEWMPLNCAIQCRDHSEERHGILEHGRELWRFWALWE